MGAKAKLLKRNIPFCKKADKLTMTVLVTVIFPDASKIGGKAQYMHSFTVKDLVPAKPADEPVDLSKSKYVSDFFPIPSDGPVTVKVEVLEYNELEKWLSKAAKSLRSVSDK
jgi:hypothetical protein